MWLIAIPLEAFQGHRHMACDAHLPSTRGTIMPSSLTSLSDNIFMVIWRYLKLNEIALRFYLR